MAQFTINVPDIYLPALIAEFGVVHAANAHPATTPEEYFEASIVEIVRQRAEMYKVGPYYVGPINPQFNADGTPYSPPAGDDTLAGGNDTTAGSGQGE